MSDLSENKRRRLSSDVPIQFDIKDKSIINALASSWLRKEDLPPSLQNSKVQVIKTPFPVCVIDDFFEEEFLKSLCKEVDSIELKAKSNDLYQFQQSDDLQNFQSEHCKLAFTILQNEVRSWLGEVFQIQFLKDKVASTFSLYENTDRLLCHDDKCENRHIAFVVYLTDQWRDDYGGTLQLFDVDHNKEPHLIVESISPKFNRLVMFEVTDVSFHQVAEVLSKDYKRLSLNGWFHSNEKNEKEAENRLPLSPIPRTYPYNYDVDLESYITSDYMYEGCLDDLHLSFTSASEMELHEYIIQNVFEELRGDLKQSCIRWSFQGPANKRRYEVAAGDSLPERIQNFKKLFESETWFTYLKHLTGLDLWQSDNSDIDKWRRGQLPWTNVEIQRWTPGCYTLVNDRDVEFHSDALDVILRFPFDGDENVSGEDGDETPASGSIIYFDKTSNESEPLLTCGSRYNALCLVYRDSDTVRFTKYIDHTCKGFFQVGCTYRQWAPPTEEPDLLHKPQSDSEEEPFSD